VKRRAPGLRTLSGFHGGVVVWLGRGNIEGSALYKLIKLQSGAGSPVFVNPASITSVQSWGDRETAVYFDKDHMLIIEGSVVETVRKLTVI
jgi:hypothetical protein